MKRVAKIFVSLITIMALLITPTIAYASDTTAENSSNGVVYLSDLDRVSTSIGYGKIGIDQNSNGNQISVYVNGRRKYFDKGIFAHAKSTLVYDLTNYNNEYDYFITYLGVDASQGSAGSVYFQIYVSDDGVNWGDPVLTTDVLTASSDSVYYELSLEGVNYIKLYADPNGGNGNDHAVYADAKLVNYESYFDASITKAEDYNADIEALYEKYGTDFDSSEAQSEQYELKVLQREFTKRVGYVGLQDFLREDNDDNKEMLDWLLNNVDVLRMFLAGGLPEGPYEDTLDVLTTLYMTYKDSDLVDESPAVGSQEESTSLRHDSNLKLKDVYLKMILADALTFSGSVYFWADGNEYSDPIDRYEIFKKMYNEKMFVEYSSFENLTVEEMRWMFNSIIDDEEIEWLNWYIDNKLNGRTNPYAFMAYTSGYNYWRDIYYDPSNYAEFDEKYGLSQFGITEPWNNTQYSSSGNPKTWIVYEEGAVCGGLSKNGGCAWTCYNGLPNTCVSQPGHCAVLYYKTLDNGDGWWELNNNISGWGFSGRTEHLSIRQMNDWGEGSYTSGYNASYILLAQAAQNEYDKYEQAETILMLEDVFSDDADTQEKICRGALEVENINFSAWLDLVNLYIDNYVGNTNDSSEDINFGKTSSDMLDLAKEIANNLKYYPLPMYDLLKLIEPYIDAGADYYEFSTNILEASLKDASKCTSSESIQATAVKEVANRLLDSVDNTVATFSFDGENAGKIVLSEDYQGSNGEANVGWEYCLEDCGSAEDCDWTLVTTNEVQLTEEQINSITPESDILIHLVGTSYSEENIFIIDILDSEIPSSVFANDLENKIFGVTDAMEWRYSDNDEWTFFSEEEPELTGDKTVEVRVAATGHYVASDIQTYEFTKDSEDVSRQYVPIANLSVVGASSDSNYYSGNPENAIDGNENTGWHTTWNGEDERWITIEFDKPIYLSAIEYLPMNIPSNLTNLGGIIKNAKIYTSMDDSSWEAVGESDWEYSMSLKSIELSKSVLAKYVTIYTPVSYNTSGTGTANYTHAAMFNFFEDTEQKVYDLQYSTTSYTNGNVDAVLTVEHSSFELSELETNDVVTGKDAEGYTTYTYTFTENGSYTFELTYDGDVVAEIEAVVDWIDKTEPEIDITETHVQTHTITIGINADDPSISNGKEVAASGVISTDLRVSQDGKDITENVSIDIVNGLYKIYGLESDTEYTFIIEATDVAGNTSSISKNITTAKMTDLNEDEVSAVLNPSGPTNKSVTVELQITDEYIQKELDDNELTLVYSLDNGTNWQTYTGLFTLDENTVILVGLQDEGENRGNCATLSIDNIDKVNPTIDVSLIDATSSSLTIKVDSADSDSGINSDSISISVSDQNSKIIDNGDGTYTISALYQNSKYSIEVYVEDNAGNSNTASIDATTNSVPSLDSNVKFIVDTDHLDESYATVTVEIKDNDIKYDVDFGEYKIQYSLNNGKTWETYILGVGITITENTDIAVRLIDDNGNVGNSASYSVDVFTTEETPKDNTEDIPEDNTNTPEDDNSTDVPEDDSKAEIPNENSSESDNKNDSNSQKTNEIYVKDKLEYKVLSDSKTEKTVEVTGAVNKSYTSLEIPSTVTIDNVEYTVIGIGSGAFENYTKLKSISVEKTVEYINHNAFKGCTNLTEVTGCTGLKTIGDDAFYKCTSLTKIENATKVTSIGEKAFAYCTKLSQIGTELGVVTLTKLKSIGSYAFYNCTALTAVKIPSGVSTIHTKTFAKCTALTSVTGCTGITKIGSYAFYGCPKLTHVNNCTKVTSIGSKAFARCTKLVRVGTETGVTTLTKLNSIGSFVFYNCSSITTIKLPSTVTAIKTKTFVRCTSLKSVTGCSGLTEIGSYAFYKCTSLTNINNATKVTSIGAKAFAYCKSLVRIGNTTSKVTLPSVKSVGDYAFYHCSKISNVAITSSNLTTIGQASFRGCTSLKTFSESSKKLNSIGKQAFYGDSKLTTISFKSTKLTSSNVGSKAFSGIKNTCIFKVPSGKGSSYKKIFIAKGASKKISVKKV